MRQFKTVAQANRLASSWANIKQKEGTSGQKLRPMPALYYLKQSNIYMLPKKSVVFNCHYKATPNKYGDQTYNVLKMTLLGFGMIILSLKFYKLVTVMRTPDVKDK